MSYTVSIKEEIASIKSNNSELIAELSGYIRNNASISKKSIKMTTENKIILDRITNSLKDIYNIDVKTEIVKNVNFSKKELYQSTISNNIDIVLKGLGIYDDNNKYLDTIPNYIIGGNEEIRAYLRGVFLTVGSVNDPKTSRYHMELLVSQAQESILVQKLLNLFDLNAKILSRDKGYMIYIKEADKISDFLKIIGAVNAVLYYEDIRVYRDKKNITNRLNNCEQANTDKIIETANEQLHNIEIIEANDGLMLLDDKVLEVVEYRKKYPETSLKELAEIISLETNKKITKSGLYHRFKKIEDLAERFKKQTSTD